MLEQMKPYLYYFKKTALFIGILFLLPLFTGCEGRRTIVNGLDEREANEIIVYLATKGIDAQKMQAAEAGGGGTGLVLWDISVKEPEAIQAMSSLNQAGLPRRRGQSLLGIFQNVGLVPTEMTEKIRYQAGLAEQIASTIRKIDGILDAEVQISFPEEDPLNPGSKKGEITASVYVKHSGVLDDPNAHLANRIKRLVTSSITGLKFENVTLIPDRARYSEIPGGFAGAGEEDKQYVQVWGLVIAKESLNLFRIIFFTFSALTLIGLLFLIWLLWKVYPLLQSHGGLKELLHLKPIKGVKKEGESELSETKEKNEKSAPAASGTPAQSEEAADSEADFEGEITFESDEDEEKK